jgi:uncharacterized protein YcbX
LSSPLVPAVDRPAHTEEQDDRLAVVDTQGRFRTQREQPRMALIETALTPDGLKITAPGMPRPSNRARSPAMPRNWFDTLPITCRSRAETFTGRVSS